jgi:uncharacterized membrane protein
MIMEMQQTTTRPSGSTGQANRRSETASSRNDSPSRFDGNQREPSNTNSPLHEQKIAIGLGWFSIALGAAEILAPQAVARLIGVRRDHNLLLRFYGLREIAAGVGILTQPRPAGPVWSRVAGDIVDLATLGALMASDDSDRERLALATAAVAGVTALDVYCAQQLSRDSESSSRDAESAAIHVKRTITVNRAPEDLYNFWRNYENFPQFMKYLESVKTDGGARSHWVAKGPLGKRVEWDAETTADVPNQRIAWRTLPKSEVYHEGSVRFQRANGGRGTRVVVELYYRPPGGLLGAGLAKLFGKEPQQEITEDLFHFKQLMETGELPTIKGQPAGRRSLLASVREDRI